MASLQTSAQLISHGLFLAHESNGPTSDYFSRSVDYINWAYRAVWMGGNEFVTNRNPLWWWLRGEGSLILRPVIKEGGVNVTNNSNIFSLFPVVAVSEDLTGRFFKVDDHPDVFKVGFMGGALIGGTLDTVYTGPTVTDGTPYKAMILEYTLAADVLQLIAPMRIYGAAHSIQGLSVRDLDERYPLDHISAGQPRYFAQISDTQVRFSHYGGDDSTTLYRVDYDYHKKPGDLANDSAEPLIPLQYRYVLADMIAMRIALDKDENDDAAFFGQSVRGTISAMIAEHSTRLGRLGEVGRIHPRANRRADSFPLRTESGSIIG